MAACEECWAQAFRISKMTGRSQVDAYRDLLRAPEHVISDHAEDHCACGWTVADEGEWERPSSPCPTLRALAWPYNAHPGYRDEWRP